MNKIIIGKKDKNRKIAFLESGEYLIDYVESGEYSIIFDIYCDVKIVESSFNNRLIVNNKYIVNNGSVKVIKVYNNEYVSEKIMIDLCSFNSKIDYNFINICSGEEEYLININHKDKRTTSNINNRSVALKNSKISFIINSNVFKECNESVLNQNTRIVTMGECDTKICPNMFIDLEDVCAKHGSVIGTFRDEQIFYLMSKGICYNDALKLLIKGYLFANLDVHMDLRAQVMKIINTYWR